MRARRPLLLIALLGFGLAVPHARADEVILIDGRTRTGKVLSEDKRYVVLETQLGRIRIARADVRDVIREDDPAGGGAESGNGTEKTDVPETTGTRRPVRPRKLDRPVPADPPETTGDPAPGGENDQPESGDPPESS